MKTGERLCCPGCSLQIIVLHPPAIAPELSCGGTGLIGLGESATAPGSHPADPAPALLGKRYIDDNGLEVLCTKAGSGELASNGTPLTLKEARQLPASD
jgi:hypothetical protein